MDDVETPSPSGGVHKKTEFKSEMVSEMTGVSYRLPSPAAVGAFYRPDRSAFKGLFCMQIIHRGESHDPRSEHAQFGRRDPAVLPGAVSLSVHPVTAPLWGRGWCSGRCGLGGGWGVAWGKCSMIDIPHFTPRLRTPEFSL